MRKIFNKLSFAFALFIKLLTVNEFVGMDAKASENVTPEEIFWINNTRNISRDLIKFINNSSEVFNTYNWVANYVDELLSFPMFYDIPESEFPQVISYFKPDSLSIKLREYIQRSDAFIKNLRVEILNIFSSLNKVMAYNNSTADVTFQKAFPDFPNFIPLKFIKNKNELRCHFLYGLSEFRELINNTEFNECLSISKNQLSILLVNNLPEHIDLIKKNLREFYLSSECYNFSEQRTELIRNLFSKVYDLSKMLNNSSRFLSVFKTIPKQLEKLYKRLSIENIMRSNFMEEIFGPTPKRIIVPVPDIIPILTHIKTELNLLNNDQSMKLFSYAANLQFLNYPIGNYHNSIDLEELAKIYIKMLFLRKNL